MGVDAELQDLLCRVEGAESNQKVLIAIVSYKMRRELSTPYANDLRTNTPTLVVRICSQIF